MKEIIYFKEKYDANISLLVAFYITSLLANLAVGYRYISLWSLIDSGGIFIFQLSFIISAITTEIYGSRFSKRMVLYGIISQIVFSLYALLIVQLPAPYFLQNKQMYYLLFNSYINFALASIISIWLGSWLNIALLSKLSEYVGGRYFVLRSFISSSIGSLFVTVVSILIANFSRLKPYDLFYMIACCFLLKTIISLFAIWPASFFVYILQNGCEKTKIFSLKKLKRPFLMIRKFLIIALRARSYIYNLELINLRTYKAHFLLLGTRTNVEMPLLKIIMNYEFISKISPKDASHIGYYSGLLFRKKTEIFNYSNIETNKSKSLYFKKGKYNISSISRDGILTIRDYDNNFVLSKAPEDIYGSDSLIIKFESSQALYIGYLAGVANRERKGRLTSNGSSRLILIK